MDVRANGIQGIMESGMVLEVGNNIQINAAMEVGSATQTVEVNANASHGGNQGELGLRSWSISSASTICRSTDGRPRS
jgi:hypothetical protein